MRRFVLCLATCLLMLPAVIVAQAEQVASAQPTDDLDHWLNRLAETASLYRERLLKFTCEETIRWFGKRRDAGTEKFGYVFVFDDEEGFTDYRTRLRKSPRKSAPRRVTPEEYNVPAYLRSAHLWAFIFKRERHQFHRYQIVGTETILDRPAVRIRFEPIAPYKERVNDWFGTAWVDQETAQLLRVEAYEPRDHEEKQRMANHAEGEAVIAALYNIQKVTTEFTVEARGMRFPGRVELRRSDFEVFEGKHGWLQDEESILQVDHTYRKYQFFGVQSKAEIDPVGDP